MEDKSTQKVHKVMLSNRRSGVLNGVIDVLSFDVGEILLETEQGMLMIKGEDLHVNNLNLDKGEIEIEGKIDSFAYSDTGKSASADESFLRRLFK